MTDGGNCSDINECLEFGICNQECENTDGSFACSCKPGYVLDEADGRTCTAVDPERKVLIFATKSQVCSQFIWFFFPPIEPYTSSPGIRFERSNLSTVTR